MKPSERTEQKQIGAMVVCSDEVAAGDRSGLPDPAGSRKILKFADSSSNSDPNPRYSNSSSPIERLDDEILVEILHRLPCSKSATRCKCVCKRWLDLINPNSDPYFVDRFMRRKYERKRKLPFCLVNKMDHTPDCSANNTDRASVSYEFLTLHKNRAFFRSMSNGGLSLRFLPCEEPDRICVLASSNGLLVCCPSLYNHSVYFICNIVTKQWLSLPPPPLCSHKARSFSGTNRGEIRAGLTYEGQGEVNADLKFDPGCRFRLVCVPATVEVGQGVEVEVFSSETGVWTLSVLQRPPDACTKWMPYFRRIVVCNGIVYWRESSVFYAFNPWDNTCRMIPRPFDLTPDRNYFIQKFGVCQGLLRAVIFGSKKVADRNRPEGKRFGVYVLKDDKWLMEHNVFFNQLTSISDDPWLDKYANSESCYDTRLLAFHPYDGDIVYLGCRKWIVQCNMRRRRWRVVDEFSEWMMGFQDFFPLALPWWPAPVPQIPQRNIPSKGSLLVAEGVKEN